MSTYGFLDLYEAAGSEAVASIPEGVYDVKVKDTRPLPESRIVFLDLEILNGPAQGKFASVNLYFPEPTNRNAMFHFRKKIAGFMSEDLKTAFATAEAAASVADGFQILADVFVGKTVTATIGLVTAEGKYKGTNELRETKVFGGIDAAGTGAPTFAAPAPTPTTVVDLPFTGATANSERKDPF